MRRQTIDEVSAVEPAIYDIVEQEHDVANLIVESEVDYAEIVVAVEYVEVFDDLVVGHVALTETHRLVEYRQGIAHAAISFLGYNAESLLLVSDTLLLGNHLQVVDNVLGCHPFEIVDLATRDDCGQNLMFLGSGENEYHMCGWLFESLQKSVERLL